MINHNVAIRVTKNNNLLVRTVCSFYFEFVVHLFDVFISHLENDIYPKSPDIGLFACVPKQTTNYFLQPLRGDNWRSPPKFPVTSQRLRSSDSPDVCNKRAPKFRHWQNEQTLAPQSIVVFFFGLTICILFSHLLENPQRMKHFQI